MAADRVPRAIFRETSPAMIALLSSSLGEAAPVLCLKAGMARETKPHEPAVSHSFEDTSSDPQKLKEAQLSTPQGVEEDVSSLAIRRELFAGQGGQEASA